MIIRRFAIALMAALQFALPACVFAGEAEWKVRFNAGLSASLTGDYRAATEHLEVALREAESFRANDPRIVTTLHFLAVHYQKQGRHAESEPLYRRALGLIEKSPEQDHMLFGLTLNNLAGIYLDQRRFAEAEPLFRRALQMQENAPVPDLPELKRSLDNLALLYREQGRHAEAELIYRRSLEISEKALGPDHPNVADALDSLGWLYRAQERNIEAEQLFRRSLAIRERTLGPQHPQFAKSLNNIGGLYESQGRFAEAAALLLRSLRIYEEALGLDHPDVENALDTLAQLYRTQGRYAEAEQIVRRVLKIRESVVGSHHPSVALAWNNLAVLYVSQGRYVEAEPPLRRSIEISEKALGLDHPSVGTALNNLAALYQEQGRYSEAEPLLRRSLALFQKSLGPDHPNVAQLLNNLALVLKMQERYAEAEPLYLRSLEVRERTLRPNHPHIAESLINLAGLYEKQNRVEDALRLFLRSLAIYEKGLGADHPDVALALGKIASLLDGHGRHAEAQQFFRRSLMIREKVFGPNHPDVMRSLSNLAQSYGMQKRWHEALELARKATSLFATRFEAGSDLHRTDVLSEQRTNSWRFEMHVSLLFHGEGNRSAPEAFEVAQLARTSDTADQVARMASRYASGSDALALLARQRQDLIARLNQIDSRIVQAASRSPKERNTATEERIRAESAETSKALTLLDARMAIEFPQYNELINPRPLRLAEVQKLLGTDEALVAFLVSRHESFLWAVRRDAVLFLRLPITQQQLTGLVRKLRAQLDLGAGDPAQILSQPFDVATAHELYLKLLAPAEKLLAGMKHLIVVPDGALTSLPLGVLITARPGAEAGGLSWLAKIYATTVLPSVGSLRALRMFSKGQPATDPFLGFGDPLLEGGGNVRRQVVAALYSRGAVADTREVKKLARLPETADELKAIARTLKASPDSVRLGEDATEQAVKKSDLARHRILAFATHGLMAGDFKGLAEPALVLTPPNSGTELDDGLLTASEVSQLKLNADWVILSACNTAAPDGTPGADGLSGLARAFFYAGARSLLVSHWAVSSEATVALTTRMFAETQKGATKAEALRRSMLALMQTPGKPHFANPAFWAPFVVVGEGGTETRR